MGDWWEESDLPNRLAEGLKVRREVLGDDYVNDALRNTDEVAEPLQQLVTEYCWGSIWTREGLSRKTRSLLNIATMIAINRPHELQLHIRGAFNNGCSKLEISEVILQSAVYVGVPAAVDATRNFRAVLTEREGTNADDSKN